MGKLGSSLWWKPKLILLCTPCHGIKNKYSQHQGKIRKLGVPTDWLLICSSENHASWDFPVTLGKLLADRFLQSIKHLPPLELVKIKCHKSVYSVSLVVKWEQQSFLSQRNTSKDYEVFWQDRNRELVSILKRNMTFSLTDAMLKYGLNVYILCISCNTQVYESNERKAWVIFLMC